MLLVYCGITRTITISPYIKPYHTSRPPALLKIPPYISFIPYLFVIVIVRSTYLSRSLLVESQGLSPFPWCSVFSQAIKNFFTSCVIVPFNIFHNSFRLLTPFFHGQKPEIHCFIFWNWSKSFLAKTHTLRSHSPGNSVGMLLS